MFHQGRQLGLASREAQLKWQMQSAPLFPFIWTRSNPVLQLVSKQVGIYKNGFHRGYLVTNFSFSFFFLSFLIKLYNG